MEESSGINTSTEKKRKLRLLVNFEKLFGTISKKQTDSDPNNSRHICIMIFKAK